MDYLQFLLDLQVKSTSDQHKKLPACRVHMLESVHAKSKNCGSVTKDPFLLDVFTYVYIYIYTLADVEPCPLTLCCKK